MKLVKYCWRDAVRNVYIFLASVGMQVCLCVLVGLFSVYVSKKLQLTGVC